MDTIAEPATGWAPLPSIELGGQRIVTSSRAELADAMARDCRTARATGFARRPRLVFDVNGQGISLRRTDPAFRQAVDQADILHADGGFLVTLSRRLAARPIAERSATTDLIHDFAARAERDGLSFYLLGATEDVNRHCAEQLQRRYPRLVIAGRRNGYFTAVEEPEVIAAITAASPDIVWVGLGKPLEQQFAVRAAPRLRAGWIVTCGGCYNFVAGDYRRAPAWMQRANLEWLHRLCANPRQLFWRYAITSPHALWLVLTHRSTHPDRSVR